MKRFSLLALAVMALVSVSCKKDRLVSQEEGVASFTISLPEEVLTKVYSDGAKATELHYAVYHNGTRIQGTNPGTPDEIAVGIKKSVNISGLVYGYVYDIVFWAQSPNADCYDFNQSAATLTVDYDGLANDENRDAFYALVDDYKLTSVSTEVKLTRPFAQINILADDVYQVGGSIGSSVQSKVQIPNIPSVLNLLSGTVDNDVMVDFDRADIPEEEHAISALKGYKYVSMNYVLAPASKTDLTTVTGTFFYNAGQNNTSLTVTNVPYQRNYRTNIIVHQLFTGTASFTVEIDPVYVPEKDDNPDNDTDHKYDYDIIN